MPDPPNQKDVLATKDNVTQSSRGLQIWGDQTGGEAEGPDEGPAEQAGDASMGTAARQARKVQQAEE